MTLSSTVFAGMFLSLALLNSLVSIASAVLVPRQASNATSGGTANGQFNNGAPQLIGEPPDNAGTPGPAYAARNIDIPFGRLYHGNISFFPKGELNTPDKNTDVWGASSTDSTSQSACGIPDNAYFDSKVAIHPYFLKYADLSRYCMQDVCISFWKEDGSSDMMLKVTDICSTDPSDPTYCPTPNDIKIDRAKAQVWLGHGGQPLDTVTEVQGTSSPEKTYWFFMKCWADGLAQPAYKGSGNWFAQPPLPNNLAWAQKTATDQYINNQKSYPAKGWPLYPNGAYNTKRDTTTAPPVSDWIPGKEPVWTPIAGGKGWGNPNAGSGGNAASVPASVQAMNGTQGTSGGASGGGAAFPAGSSGSGGSGARGPASSSTNTASPAASSGSQGAGQGSGSETGQGSNQGTSAAQSSPGSTSTPPSAAGGDFTSGGQAGHWEQCGGKTWTGATTCAAGYTCQVQNPWYSQCL